MKFWGEIQLSPLTFSMACLLILGSAAGMLLNIKIVAAVLCLYLLVSIPLSAFISIRAVEISITAAIVLQCGYFLGMIIRSMLGTRGVDAIKMWRTLRYSRTRPKRKK